nr:Zn 2Cys6 transcription factor [Sanghuangporus sanghuang]
MPVARTKAERESLSPASTGSDANTPTENASTEKGKNLKPIKRKRQSQSCDACRARKVRCARDNQDDPQTSCKHCIALGIPCTYDYQPKKRGPPNLYLRRLQEAAAAAAAAQAAGNGTDVADPTSPGSGVSRKSPTQPPAVVPSQNPTSPFLESSINPINGMSPSAAIPPSRYPIAADTYHPHYPGMPTIPDITRRVSESSAAGPPLGASRSIAGNSSASESFSTYPLYNWSVAYKQQAQLPIPPPNALPPLSYYYRPHRLEDVAPRETIMLIINLFFDFVYPLTPCVHKPSFMADLHSRREERDPLFFALVMSTCASTLVQVPRSYLPMERHTVRKLAQICHESSRHITVASYDPPQSVHVVIRYLCVFLTSSPVTLFLILAEFSRHRLGSFGYSDTVYHFCEGHDATSHASFGEAAHIAVTLHMHEEASYEGLDPIECEVRRRTFWLLFGADKSMSILLGRPICLRDEDCTVHFPKEVDDEYITPNGILPQPAGKTAIISGLNYISRIFALLGEIQVRIRVDKRSPPQGPFATARLEEVRSLHTRIMSALMHAPPPLRLKSAGVQVSHLPAELGGAGFRQATFAEVKDFFDNPNASRANAMNAFLVMQANLYVTQYRDELIAQLRGTNDARAIEEHEQAVAEGREAVASDLLNVLHSIPIQSIATNGPSLVHKVRFVASTLLDAVRKAETAPASAARAHAYLWDFLSILSEIERNYLLDDDRDGGSSGDSAAMLSS